MQDTIVMSGGGVGVVGKGGGGDIHVDLLYTLSQQFHINLTSIDYIPTTSSVAMNSRCVTCTIR